MRMGHLALKRAIRFAAARDLVGRNVAEFCEAPAGQEGRPSRPFALEQSAALITASAGTGIGAYIALSLGTGIRTGEARALDWDAVDLGDPTAAPPRPASVAVWRSVRRSGDTKTLRSRRTLRVPLFAADALRELQARENRDTRPVSATRDGNPLDAANVRREFRTPIQAAGIDGSWPPSFPPELRRTFVSLMSDNGVPVEEIARLAGIRPKTIMGWLARGATLAIPSPVRSDSPTGCIGTGPRSPPGGPERQPAVDRCCC